MAKDRQRIENTSGVIWIQDTSQMTICQYQISGNDQKFSQVNARLLKHMHSPAPSPQAGERKTGAPFHDAPQTVKKPIREVWRAATLQMQTESGDMCGGFGKKAAAGLF